MSPQRRLERTYREFKRRALPTRVADSGWLVGPDLIHIHDDYLKSKHKIAIIGQQVHGWYYDFPEFLREWPISEAVKEYTRFDYAHDKREPECLRTPFWKFFHDIRRAAYGDDAESHCTVLWTNAIKFVTKRGSDSVIWEGFSRAEPAIRIQGELLLTELRIARPKVCIFVTGPDFDFLLERYFPGLQRRRVARFKEHVLARLVHPALPLRSFRTYHPQYLVRRGLRSKVFNALCRELW